MKTAQALYGLSAMKLAKCSPALGLHFPRDKLVTRALLLLTRMSVEDYWMHTTNGAAFQAWLVASRVLETNVWDLAMQFLQPAQVAELRAGIREWYARTPEVRTAFFARPHAFGRDAQAPCGCGARTIRQMTKFTKMDHG